MSATDYLNNAHEEENRRLQSGRTFRVLNMMTVTELQWDRRSPCQCQRKESSSYLKKLSGLTESQRTYDATMDRSSYPRRSGNGAKATI